MSNAENNQHTLAVAPFRQKSTCSRESSTPQLQQDSFWFCSDPDSSALTASQH